ncbi:MAG: hypothetical protein ACE5FL_12545 [Myxococcota bacterium]
MSNASPAPPVLAIVPLALGALSCASASGGGEAVSGGVFPSQREVERIENAPPPEAVFDADLRQVDEWILEAAVPKRIDARRWVERTPWGSFLGDVTTPTGGRVVPTKAMHCVASEIARFALERGGRPDLSVRRFIIAACNASVANVSFRSLQGEVGSSERDEEIFERWRDDSLSLVQDKIDSRQRSVVGIGFVRRGKRAAVYVASGRPLAEIERVETRLARNEPFELRGRVLVPAISITAAINRGRYDVAPCEPVGHPTPPAFQFVCEPDPADESAWVSLSFTPPNRVLGKRALNALVWPNGGQTRAFRRFEYSSPRPIADAALFAPAFLDELNQVRARAGLHPVALDAAQSATATRVAPHFFAAITGATNERTADEAVLGLLAGWDVEGDIRSGSFTFGAVPETDDLAMLLAATLEEPLARFTLLDPQTDRLAVGPILGEAGDTPVLAAVVTGYSLFDEGTKNADAEALFTRLTAARHERELPPPYRLVKVWLDAMHSADEVRYGETPKHALDDLLQTSVTTLSREVLGWYRETSELGAFEFPEEMLSAPRLGTAIGVSHRKEPGEAWGRYVVLIVSVAH